MQTTATTKEVYFNEKQIEFVEAQQKTRVIVAGRGFGKSTLIALIIYKMLGALPKAKIFFSSTTLEQILNSTLPPIMQKLEEFGIIENQLYVICKRPPAWFKKPYSSPKSYDNVITFWNGFTIVLLSTAKPTGKRGGSYDAGIVDEAAFVKAITFRTVLSPMVRANLYRYDSHLHHSMFLLTSQPTTGDGHFVMQFEKEFEADPDAVLFMWASAKDNEVVLGKEWFRQMRKTMGESAYLSEVENLRTRKLPNGFYHRFDRDRHGYTPSYDDRGRMLDVRTSELLEAVWDFGGSFNCCSAWQESNNVEYCVGRFHTKEGENKFTGVVDKFCEHFRDHRFKYVRLWGEPRGRDSSPWSDDDIYVTIRKRFEFHGWECEIKVPEGKQAKKHKERFQFIETIMNETDYNLPKVRFNLIAAEDVIKSLEGAGIHGDFQKDKSKEQEEGYPQEWATHYSDGLDNYLDQKHYWKYSGDLNQEPGRVDFL